MARAITAHYGMGSGDAVQEAMNATPVGHAMQRAHTIFRKTGLELNIRKTVIAEGSCKGLTVLKLTDTIQFMMENSQLHRLYGGLSLGELVPTLILFWERFRAIHPELDVFSAFDAGEALPGCTIPIFTHGDEGRGSMSFTYKSVYIYIYIHIYVVIHTCVNLSMYVD
jgi:hypothetical protein